MKGVIFTVFEEFVGENWGEDVYDDILDACPELADAVFVAPQSYPDEWLVSLLTAACKRLDVDAPTALRAFGTFAFGAFVERYPAFLEGIDHPRPFILSVHDIIHVEVKKLMAGAKPPDFVYENTDDDGRLVVHYESDRGLCQLMEGLLAGAAQHFGVPIESHQSACTHEGAERCTFELTFPSPVEA